MRVGSWSEAKLIVERGARSRESGLKVFALPFIFSGPHAPSLIKDKTERILGMTVVFPNDRDILLAHWGKENQSTIAPQPSWTCPMLGSDKNLPMSETWETI